jgi:S-formylglutathione hydrolase FrmB
MTVVRVPEGRGHGRIFERPYAGSVRLERIESTALEGNPLGDPSERSVAVYTPPSGSTEGRPLLVHLAGFTGSGPAEAQNEPFLGENLFRRFDRLIHEGRCGEAVLIAPDCQTSLGGSQYVDSSAIGRYEQFLLADLLPWARERLRTRGTALLGQSSGGFGALNFAFDHPEAVDAVASSAGDMDFDPLYAPEFPRAVRVFRNFGGPEKFLQKLYEDPTVLRGPFDPTGSALVVLASAAAYSPVAEEPGAFELPFDLETGARDAKVWERWRRFDPLVRVASPTGRASLSRLRAVVITASTEDEWYLDLGARRFAQTARAGGLSVDHLEFPGGHFARGPRFDAMFERLVRAIAGASTGGS